MGQRSLLDSVLIGAKRESVCVLYLKKSIYHTYPLSLTLLPPPPAPSCYSAGGWLLSAGSSSATA